MLLGLDKTSENNLTIKSISMDIQFKYQNNASKISKPFKSLLNTSVVLSPAAHKTSSDKITKINLCLQEMNTTQQKVFVLKTIKKQKTQDICAQLNITENEFWNHLNAARKELIEKLQIA